jgi:hypothetical protein
VPTSDPFDDLARLEGVPSALVAARDGADAILRDRGRRATTPDLTAEALLRGAAASGSLAGSTSSLDDLRSGAADALAVAAARVNAGLLALVPVVQRTPAQAMARIHTLAAVGLADPESLGRPRPDEGVAHGLQLLAERLIRPTAAPALAVAAIVHAEIATTRPFAAADDLVARAMERLLLVARGVDPACVLVPEAGHAAGPAVYDAALEGYASGELEGRRRWLLYAADAFSASLVASPLNSA